MVMFTFNTYSIMAQKTWKKISGTWKEIINIWVKVSSVWQSGAISYIKVSTTWEPCFYDGFSVDWDGYIVWAFDYEDTGVFYFIALNTSTVRDGISSTMYWETRDGSDAVVDSGSVASGTLDHGESSYPTDAVTGAYVTLWGKTATSQWNQLV